MITIPDAGEKDNREAGMAEPRLERLDVETI
jgi:hypothetical protein